MGHIAGGQIIGYGKPAHDQAKDKRDGAEDGEERGRSRLLVWPKILVSPFLYKWTGRNTNIVSAPDFNHFFERTENIETIAGEIMKLSVIMPVFNERENLPVILERVRRVPIEKELIVVDDGSTDGSREWLQQNITNENEHLILHSENLGKGLAIRTAIPRVTGDIVVIQDADLEYDPADWQSMVRPILNSSAQVVYGSRNLGGNREKSSWLFFLGGVLVSAVTSVLYGALITDAATCYKMVRADLLKSIPLTCTSFEFCHELTAKIRRRKIKIIEVPIKYYPRKVSEGKKVRLIDFFLALKMLIKYRFGKV